MSVVLLLAVLRQMFPVWTHQQHYRVYRSSSDSLWLPQTFLDAALDPPLPLRYFSTESPLCCLRDHEEHTVIEGHKNVTSDMIFKTVIFIRKCISRSQGSQNTSLIQWPEGEAQSQVDQEKHKKNKKKKGRRNVEMKSLIPRPST